MSEDRGVPTLEIAEAQRCQSSRDTVIVEARGTYGQAFRLAMTADAADILIAALSGKAVAARPANRRTSVRQPPPRSNLKVERPG